MAALKILPVLGCAVALGACGRPTGLGGQVTPLAQIHLQAVAEPPGSGAGLDGGGGQDLDAGPAGAVDGGASALRAALVWGLQWLPEPFCVLPPESPEAAAVIAAGCRDGFGFVPDRVAAETAIALGVPTTIDLVSLPAADVMVGDLTARIAYGSLLVYEDRNGNGVLDLRHPPRQRRGGEPPPADAGGPADLVLGSSFISMTLPDQRLAFREGGFDATVAFYPRAGCPPPPPGFSLLSAGGFSAAEALTSALAGQLPAEDPATCATAQLDATVIVPLPAPVDLRQLACTANDHGGVTYYREAPASAPDLSGRAWACASFPHLPGDDAGVPAGQQLVVAGAPGEPCPYTFHYTLRGCNSDPGCPTPTWDISGSPPPWWPCLGSP